jgi:putative endonuclease
MSRWFVYILRCADDTLYTGITTDVSRRINEHNGLSKIKGAKCTRARRPVKLVYSEPCTDRSAAGKREWEIKQLSRTQKMLLIKK